MATRVTVSGLRELDKALGELSKATAKGVLRRVGTEALKPMIETARGIVASNSVDDGGLRDSLAVATKLSKRQARQHRKMFRDDRASVELFAGAAAERHAHLIEFGTGERRHKSGKSVGKGPAEPFMRPAWDAHKGQILESIANDLGGEIRKTAARVAKRRASKA